MTWRDALGWMLVGGLGLIFLALFVIIVVAAVATLKKNPLKQSFDTDPDVLPEAKEQDK